VPRATEERDNGRMSWINRAAALPRETLRCEDRLARNASALPDRELLGGLVHHEHAEVDDQADLLAMLMNSIGTFARALDGPSAPAPRSGDRTILSRTIAIQV